ncbi:hypothetical protein COO60DRAFT_1285707 [Scenedesmus sp. NREL 46B-D3]|nr:hypothetical protein COO60DRAFT_1285707 [Scenedesmus sp. NREL 46B-D3]
MAPRPIVKLLRLARFPILQQLQLEEALLRATKCNWFIVNDGTPRHSIVMGISGKVQELINVHQAQKQQLQVIKRFTGGGTVVVDHNTVFTSLIMQDGALQGLECFPVPIMRWTESFYMDVFRRHGDFRLQEHDYVFGERKFGGNAQAITNKRWLHHTSFLWDFYPANMAALQNPAKQPEYRQGREHGSFLVRLKECLPSRQQFIQELQENADQHFELRVRRAMCCTVLCCAVVHVELSAQRSILCELCLRPADRNRWLMLAISICYGVCVSAGMSLPCVLVACCNSAATQLRHAALSLLFVVLTAAARCAALRCVHVKGHGTSMQTTVNAPRPQPPATSEPCAACCRRSACRELARRCSWTT